MVVVERSEQIDASPEAVTSVLLDAELAPLWTAGLDRLELVSGVPGRVGCVGRAHYRSGRRHHVLTDELLEAVPHRYYRSHITGGGVSVDVETRLKPSSGGGTRLTLHWSGTGTNLVTRLMLPRMRRRISSRVDADLHSLRALVEEREAR